MRFFELLTLVVALLQREGRVSYRALKLEFALDEAHLEALRDELIYAKRLATDEGGRVLVWVGSMRSAEVATLAPTTADSAIHTALLPPTLPPLITSVMASDPLPGPLADGQRILAAALPDDGLSDVPLPVALQGIADAERRQLTVMFCDLVGSTPLSERLDPEDLREIVHAYQETAAQVIQRYNGHIAQYLGDGLLVYFGYPQAHEDDIQRAVWTGLGIVEAMGQLNMRLEREKTVQLAIRIGIHTGLVVVGAIGGGGRHEHLALGETPNIAARLEGLATPNTVVISATVYHIVRGYFVCRNLGTHQLKGISEPLTIYQVLQPSGAQNRLSAAVHHGLSPFIGREVEYGRLETAWRHARQGQGQFCWVVGNAGVGKSRLVYEFARVLDHAQVYTIQASTSGHTLLYCPFRVLSQQLLELPDELSPGVLQDTLADALQRHNLPGRHTAALTMLLGGAVEKSRVISYEPQDEQQPMHAAVCDLLRQKATGHPCIVILEDVHWFDNASQALLASLIEMLAAIPLLLIGTVRLPFTPRWHDATHITRLMTRELSQEATGRLLNHVLAPSHAALSLVAFIHERTEGNPLFIEELVQSLQQGSYLDNTAEGMTLAQAPDGLPPTIHSLLAARLDRLPDVSKQLALAAAVVGLESSEALLVRLVEPAYKLSAHMAALQHHGVLTRHIRGQEVYYRFTHALLQEVAYSSLLRSERQAYHCRIAQALEALYQERLADYAEILAYHYTRSLHPECAMAYLLKASERARRVSAVAEAFQYLRDAHTILDTLDRLPEYTSYRIEVLLHQERLYDELGRREQQQTLIVQLLALLQGSDDQARLAEVYVRQGDLYTQVGRFAEAEQALETALHLRRTLADTAGESQVLRSLGFLRWYQGQYAAALAHNEAALALDRQRHDRLGVATDLTNLGTVWRSLGEHERALACLQEALEVYEATGHQTRQAFTLYSMANIHREMQALEHAMRQYQQAYDIFTDHRDRQMAGRALAGIASILWEQGNRQESLRLYHEVLQITRDTQHGQSLAQALRTLGELLVTLDESQQALPYLHESTTVYTALADHASAAAVWATIASIYEQHGANHHEAFTAWERVRAHRTQEDNPRGALEALQQMVRLARHRLYDPALAMQYLHDAIRLAEALEDQALQGELRNTMGIIAWRQERYAEALEYYEQALQLYRHLGDAAHAGVLLNSIGVTLRCMKRYDEALARLQEAVATNRQAQQRLYEGHGLAAMGDVYRDLGNYEQARVYYRASLQLRQEIGDRRGEGWMLSAIAQAYVAQDLPAEAQGCIECIAAIAEQCKDEDLQITCKRIQDELHSRQEA